MGRMKMAGAMALAMALALAAPAGVTGAQAQTTINMGQTAPAGVEAADLAKLEAAMRDFQRRGYPGLRRHLTGLRQAMERAPESYGTIEAVSDAEWVVRSDSMGDGLMLSFLASAAAAQENPDGQVAVSIRPNVYPMIALILGSEAVERGAMDEAIGYLDRGLSMQPGNAILTAEKMAAMQAQGRMAEALAVGDAAVEPGGLPLSEGRGPLQRRRGFSLIELGRLDEARAAYEASLEHDPDHPAALHQLQYIDELEAGGERRVGVLIRNSE